jgi:hypothetical protein
MREQARTIRGIHPIVPYSRPAILLASLALQSVQNMGSVFPGPADILKNLLRHDFNSAEFSSDLKSLLCSKDYREFSLELPEPELTALVELLDHVKVSPSSVLSIANGIP